MMNVQKCKLIFPCIHFADKKTKTKQTCHSLSYGNTDLLLVPIYKYCLIFLCSSEGVQECPDFVPHIMARCFHNIFITDLNKVICKSRSSVAPFGVIYFGIVISTFMLDEPKCTETYL